MNAHLDGQSICTHTQHKHTHIHLCRYLCLGIVVTLDGVSFAKFSSNFAFSLWKPNAELQLPSQFKLCHFRGGRNIKMHRTEKEPTVLIKLRAPETNLTDINSVYIWQQTKPLCSWPLAAYVLTETTYSKGTPYSSFKSIVRGILLFDFFFFEVSWPQTCYVAKDSPSVWSSFVTGMHRHTRFVSGDQTEGCVQVSTGPTEQSQPQP